MQDFKGIINTANKLAEQLTGAFSGVMDSLPPDERAKVEAEIKKLEKASNKLNAKIKKT